MPLGTAVAVLLAVVAVTVVAGLLLRSRPGRARSGAGDVVAALLNAAFDVCLGCVLYVQLVRAGLVRSAQRTA